ncbi:MAG: hypothetical protein INH41_08110 [Myxococcaceae bacterium]|nr:hypothetical protein [Myxococcaceae bacterium]MCA3012349.1 hypothetical protein [Myxococcaceae bacterium]
MHLPRYFFIGDRPVKLVATPDGGLDVLALDWDTAEFVRDLRYLSRCLHGDGEVDEVDAPEFDARVAREVARARGSTR